MSRVVGKSVFTYGITQTERQVPYIEGKGEMYSALSVADGFDTETPALIPMEGPALVADGGGVPPAADHCRSNEINAIVTTGREVYIDKNMESCYDRTPAIPQSRLLPHDRGFISATANGLYYTELPGPTDSISYGYVHPQPRYTRPFGAKSHNDVISGYSPSVTMSAWPGTQLCASSADSNVWTPGANVTPAESDTKVVFTFGSSVTADQILGECDTDVADTSIKWLLVDMMLSGDPQKYDTTGFFANDQSQLTSGYKIRLVNTAGSDYRDFRIPRFQSLNVVNRMLLYIGDIGFDVATVAVMTDTLYLPGDGRSLTLYTGPSVWAGWTGVGNWALPDVTWKPSPMYDVLSNGNTTTTNTETSETEMITDGTFSSTSPSGWGLTGYAPSGYSLSGTGAVVQGDGIYYSPSLRLEIDGKALGIDASPCIDLGLSNQMTVDAGRQYQIEWYEYGDSWYKYNVALYMDDETVGSDWNSVASQERMSLVTGVTYADAANDPYQLAYNPQVPLQWFSPAQRFKWSKRSIIVTIPAGVAAVRVGFSNAPMWTYLNNMSIDNVSMKVLPVKNSGSAYFMQTLTEAGDDMKPDLPRVKYAASMAYKTNILPSAGWKLMQSNLSNDSVTNDVADPWRTPTITNDAIETIVTDYNAYIAGVMVYRSFKYPEVTEWEPYEFIGGVLSHSGNVIDNTLPGESPSSFAGKAVDVEPEMYADYPSPAKFVSQSAGRVYAAYLDGGARKTAIQVSGYSKPWAFTTTFDDNTPWTAGTELDGYAITGTEVRCIAMRADEKVVLLDSEVFSLRGSNPSQGYVFVKVAGVGCVSADTVVDCNGALVWSDGRDFYAYVGADAAVNISRNKIPLIDWSGPVTSTYARGKYLCHAKEANTGLQKLFMYDFDTYSWTVHTNAAPPNTASLWGEWVIDNDGALWKLWEGDRLTSPYVAGTYWEIAPNGYDAHASSIIVEARSSGESTLTVTALWDGAAVGTRSYMIPISSTQTRYVVPCNIHANHVKLSVSQSGDPATIYFIGMEVDDAPTRQ